MSGVGNRFSRLAFSRVHFRNGVPKWEEGFWPCDQKVWIYVTSAAPGCGDKSFVNREEFYDQYYNVSFTHVFRRGLNNYAPLALGLSWPLHSSAPKLADGAS